MKKQFIKLAGMALLAAALFFVSSCKKDAPSLHSIDDAETTTTEPHTVYLPVWADEFNGNTVDTTKWNFQIGNPGGDNNEKEYYQAANAAVSNGNLVITAKNEAVGGMQYTSARLNTLNKISMKYGRIEARIKLPMVQGMWPAFWMEGNNINNVGWPKCGEIDVMEQVNTSNTILGTVHWDNNGHMQYGDSTTVANPGDYHVYAVEWDSSSIRWYVDGKQYGNASTAGNVNNSEEFNTNPFFIILNVAVGGKLPGDAIGSLPASMYVDYVRVYKGLL